MTVQGQAVKIHRTGHAEVLGLGRVKVGGQVVDCWRIKRTDRTKTEFSGGNLETDTEGVECVSTRHGLKLTGEGTTKVKSSFGGQERRNETKVSETLLSVVPK